MHGARWLTAAALLAATGCAPKAAAPRGVKVVPFGASDRDYVEVVGGPPESASMESGVVALAPGKSVGAHDTKDYEEIVIPLEGRGELRVAGRAPVALAPGMAVYSPPHTAHDVANVGGEVFRYVFVAAKAP